MAGNALHFLGHIRSECGCYFYVMSGNVNLHVVFLQKSQSCTAIILYPISIIA
jgi:hypothetical protein